MEQVVIIGGGLAGVEAAFFLAEKGIKVKLYEMRPGVMTPAHHSAKLGELVCSNSLKSKELTNACGLLKKEMEIYNSLMTSVAARVSVPGGNALCVDRELYSEEVTRIITTHPLIKVVNEEVVELPSHVPVIIASGPLTSKGLENTISKLIDTAFLHFFDASAPIIEKDSINMDIAYYKSRYDQGDDAYINCPFTKEEYYRFYDELINAKLAPIHEMDTKYFDACMPLEVIAKRGPKTLRFGPLKPRGLGKDEHHKPYAVLQLRQDNVIGSLYNLVGFQTNLTYAEQRRVFKLIPGLENAEFVRYGLMHRNTFVNAPRVLNLDKSLKVNNDIYIAGQLSGVEGYVESAASGLYVALNVYAKIKGVKLEYPCETMLGSLMHYLNNANPENFAPMNANFGIVRGATKQNRMEIAEKSLKITQKYKEYIESLNE
ncbi:MAG TPA: methylenetetrahydrofolate--tRNA-(uracil(54)-C(5))-methyltransferase (FADH(2)-oxidizing) TrmFO [Bacilli bacterium]|nr:methylenetetrahydrofolate--tRNA-(uracil(54)-C(5))-methyltransferase (FADH(2)-oxidizing) TrmFO [Bacilli bacterium]